MTRQEWIDEIRRVDSIIQTTKSPYLRRDMLKYRKRLERMKTTCNKSRLKKSG